MGSGITSELSLMINKDNNTVPFADLQEVQRRRSAKPTDPFFHVLEDVDLVPTLPFSDSTASQADSAIKNNSAGAGGVHERELPHDSGRHSGLAQKSSFALEPNGRSIREQTHETTSHPLPSRDRRLITANADDLADTLPGFNGEPLPILSLDDFSIPSTLLPDHMEATSAPQSSSPQYSGEYDNLPLDVRRDSAACKSSAGPGPPTKALKLGGRMARGPRANEKAHVEPTKGLVAKRGREGSKKTGGRSKLLYRDLEEICNVVLEENRVLRNIIEDALRNQGTIPSTSLHSLVLVLSKPQPKLN